MISFTLVCDKDHEFEAWFRTGDDYAAQAEKELLSCPVCGSTVVTKALMAPSVGLKGNRAQPEPAQRQPEAKPELQAQPLAMPSDPEVVETVEKIRKLRDKLLRNSEYVGEKFAEEARRIHYEEAERRGIHGEASPEDAKELLDEGIDVLALPKLPEDKN